MDGPCRPACESPGDRVAVIPSPGFHPIHCRSSSNKRPAPSSSCASPKASPRKIELLLNLSHLPLTLLSLNTTSLFHHLIPAQQGASNGVASYHHYHHHAPKEEKCEGTDATVQQIPRRDTTHDLPRGASEATNSLCES